MRPRPSPLAVFAVVCACAHPALAPSPAPAAAPANNVDIAVARARGAAQGFTWEPWSPEVFARAAHEHRFILVDGAAEWCHWCHVMDETTYRDAEVGEALRQRFVAIRVDVDSRPDIADRYGDWGWPATILLSPDAEELHLLPAGRSRPARPGSAVDRHPRLRARERHGDHRARGARRGDRRRRATGPRPARRRTDPRKPRRRRGRGLARRRSSRVAAVPRRLRRARPGLARLAEATGDVALLARARAIAARMEASFADPETGACYAQTTDKNAVGVFARRRQPLEDNLAAARFLAAASRAAHEPALRARAARTLAAVLTPDALEHQGSWLGAVLLALDDAGAVSWPE